MTQHENLATALAAFQAELPKLRKTETAKVTGESKSGGRINYSYGYAGLDEVVETVLPVLGKHGMSVTSKTAFNDSGFTLLVTLKHESGESEVGEWPLPNPRQAGPQDLGSAMTYGRRYLTLALTGTFPGGEDDDGANAQASSRALPQNFNDLPRERPQNAPVSPAGPKTPKVFTDAEVLGMHTKIDDLELDKAGALYDWMAGRDLHSRPVGDIPTSATTRFAVRLAAFASSEEVTVENLAWIREFADGRGLLKTQVSPKSNLAEWLGQEKDRRVQEAVDASGNAQAMRAAAGDSWDDKVADHAIEAHGNADPAGTQ